MRIQWWNEWVTAIEYNTMCDYRSDELILINELGKVKCMHTERNGINAMLVSG